MVEEAPDQTGSNHQIPPPPPAPTNNWPNSNSSKLDSSSSQAIGENKPSKKEGHVTIDGARVPEAIASAFADPSKTKKPFSYFKGGIVPDLPENPTPSRVKRSSSGSNIFVRRPRVLAIVSDSEEEKENMPTISHLQYNSPLPLYSRQSAQEAYTQQTGGFGTEKKGFDPSQSATYKLLMEQEEEQKERAVTPHSAMLDEHPKQEEFPHYHGFVDPYQQSPSFKRLQFVTTGRDDDDTGAQAQQAVRSHSETRHQQQQSTNYSVQHHQPQPRTPEPQPIAMPPPSHQPTAMMPPPGNPSPNPGPHHEPHRIDPSRYEPTIVGPPVAQHDPITEAEHQQIDPNFAAKIAEAERPKVPHHYDPTWASNAHSKHSKWERAGVDPRDIAAQHYATGAEVPANWEGRSYAAAQEEWEQRHVDPAIDNNNITRREQR